MVRLYSGRAMTTAVRCQAATSGSFKVFYSGGSATTAVNQTANTGTADGSASASTRSPGAPQCHGLERFRVAGVSGAGSGQAAVFGDSA